MPSDEIGFLEKNSGALNVLPICRKQRCAVVSYRAPESRELAELSACRQALPLIRPGLTISRLLRAGSAARGWRCVDDPVRHRDHGAAAILPVHGAPQLPRLRTLEPRAA